MLDDDQKDDDKEGNNQPKEEPHINQFDIGRGRELGRDGVVKRVHDKHGRNGYWYTCLEVLALEVEGGLKTKTKSKL